jgi:phosphoheptose isomerase
LTTTDMSRLASAAHAYVAESAETTRRSADACVQDLLRAVDVVAQSFKSGGKLLICGNGGSAADAQHLATEFTSTLTRDFVRPSLPAIALTTDTSFLTAYGNDFGFDGIFARQVEGLGRRGDALLALSTSGNSQNIVRAIETAKSMGIATIAFTGLGGGRAAELAAIAIRVPSKTTGHIQEAHVALYHALCAAVEDILYPGRRTDSPPAARRLGPAPAKASAPRPKMP